MKQEPNIYSIESRGDWKTALRALLVIVACFTVFPILPLAVLFGFGVAAGVAALVVFIGLVVWAVVAGGGGE